jgi:MerR family redox-sensitive transcriptional activator SoxR
MTIGDAARQAGLEASAIRYYERIGILPAPARQGGRRQYDAGILDLLALVRFAREVGFSVREVKALFGRQVDGERISQRWRSLAQNKIAEFEEQIVHLQTGQELLRRVMACRCVEPAECGRQLRRAEARLQNERTVRRES